MAIIVTDNFNRANDPLTLGTATTGQVWANVGTAVWGILSSAADCQVDPNQGFAVIESGFRNTIVQATVLDVTAGGNLNALNWGLAFCFVDINNWYLVAYDAFNPHFLRLSSKIGGVFKGSYAPGHSYTPVNGDVIRVENCGDTVTTYVNNVLLYTASDPDLALLTGTKQGLQCGEGVVTPPQHARWDDFSVASNSVCPGTVSYNCTVDGCVDPGDGSGTYGTLAACLAACAIPATYNCVTGVCVDPGDGTGEFDTLEACQSSGCGTIITDAVETVRFDAGTGSAYYLIPPLVDSGEELRSKVMKAMRATGRFTNASMKAYGYDVSDPINATDLEQGLNASTSAQAIPDSTQVAQSPRKQINVPNAVLSTIRIEGSDVGNTERDEIHELSIEQAEQGVRR